MELLREGDAGSEPLRFRTHGFDGHRAGGDIEGDPPPLFTSTTLRQNRNVKLAQELFNRGDVLVTDGHAALEGEHFCTTRKFGRPADRFAPAQGTELPEEFGNGGVGELAWLRFTSLRFRQHHMGHASQLAATVVDGDADAGADKRPQLPVVTTDANLSHADRAGKKLPGSRTSGGGV